MTPAPLTLRQHEIVTLLARGYSYKRVGATLGIATRTVKGHVSRIAARYDEPTLAPLRVVLAHAPAMLAGREEAA